MPGKWLDFFQADRRHHPPVRPSVRRHAPAEESLSLPCISILDCEGERGVLQRDPLPSDLVRARGGAVYGFEEEVKVCCSTVAVDGGKFRRAGEQGAGSARKVFRNNQ